MVVNFVCRFWAFTRKSFGVAALNDEAQILFDTENVSRYFQDYFHHVYTKTQKSLPPQLLDWINADKNDSTQTDPPVCPNSLCLCHAGLRLVITQLIDNRASRILLFSEEKHVLCADELTKVGFTPRESEVFLWMSEGKPYSVIATILGMSARTVGNHAQSIFKKLDVSTRADALLYVLETLGQQRYAPLPGNAASGWSASCLGCPRSGLMGTEAGGHSRATVDKRVDS